MRSCWVLVVCGGCFANVGPVAGYGTQRGFYAGGAVGAGINVAGASLELGGTGQGALTQLRLDLDATKTRFTHWSTDANTPYPGARGGLGVAWTGGDRAFAGSLGADLSIQRSNTYCSGVTVLSVGIEYRYVAHESQVVLAPRAERLSDICLR